jgi:YD repeat-containing protein
VARAPRRPGSSCARFHARSTTPDAPGQTRDRTLTFSSDGPWATSAGYHVDLATNAGFSPVLSTSGDVTSSAKAWAIPVALTPGTTYYWRAKVKDSSGNWTQFSTTASFVYDLANLGLQSQFGTEGFDLGGGDQASVNASTGNLVLSHPIVSLPIRGGSTGVALTYNSQDPASVDMGPGWRLNVHRRLTVNPDSSVTFTDADGARYTFTNPVTVGSVTTYTRPLALFATLRKDTGQTNPFSLTYRELSRDVFDTSGLLKRAEDRHANGVDIGYASGRINTITDTAGSRTIDIAYDGSNRVASVTDSAWVSSGVVQMSSGTGARRVTRFFYDGSGNLSGWADPLNTTGSCPTGGGHLTCLAYGSTLAISKLQTVEVAGASSLTTSTRTITTEISLVGTEVTSVKDAEQVAQSACRRRLSDPRRR